MTTVPVTAPARSRKQLLTDLRRREILAAAVKVFGRQGFADTCVDDIAAAAKIAKGTLYLYFRSKEEIYVAAIQAATEQLHRLATDRLTATTGLRKRLTAAIAVRMDFWHEQLGLYRLLLTVGRETRHRRQTHALLRAGHAHFLGILREGRAEIPAPQADDASLDALAWAILDLVRGANERRLDKLAANTPEQDAAMIAQFALRQLRLGD